MEELLKKCEKCGGNGSGVMTKESAWSASLPPQKANEAEVVGGRCPACNGRGKILTEEGKRIREVMKHVECGGR